jgi:hypothetical protein
MNSTTVNQFQPEIGQTGICMSTGITGEIVAIDGNIATIEVSLYSDTRLQSIPFSELDTLPN